MKHKVLLSLYRAMQSGHLHDYCRLFVFRGWLICLFTEWCHDFLAVGPKRRDLPRRWICCLQILQQSDSSAWTQHSKGLWCETALKVSARTLWIEAVCHCSLGHANSRETDHLPAAQGGLGKGTDEPQSIARGRACWNYKVKETWLSDVGKAGN